MGASFVYLQQLHHWIAVSHHLDALLDRIGTNRSHAANVNDKVAHMDDEFVLQVFPAAWSKIKEYIDTVTFNTGTASEDRRAKAIKKKSVTASLVAVLVGINSRTFQDHLADKDFVKVSCEKFHSDSRVAQRVRLIVKFYWNLLGRSVDSAALSSIFAGAMKTGGHRSSQLDQYVGGHVFIHLDRNDGLFAGAIDIGKNDNGEMIFVHHAQHKNTDDGKNQIEIDYHGIVVPYNDGMILFSIGANKATPYFRMFNANTVHDCKTSVTYGIYSGRTTMDNRIFSARAALIPADIWTTVKKNTNFQDVVKNALKNKSSDKAGALVVPSDLRTLYP